jgi:hypothetical protein
MFTGFFIGKAAWFDRQFDLSLIKRSTRSRVRRTTSPLECPSQNTFSILAGAFSHG